MEKNELKELKELLKEISNVINKYNELNPEEKVKLIKQNQVDVSNLFVCAYNNGCVGLFERIGWIERDFFLETKYLGEVYVGVNSDYVGIKANLEKGYYVDKWYRPGVEVRSYSDGKYYVSNCYMSYSISFDDIRMLMYSEKLIDTYELGKATNDEIIDVLAYARKHFEVSNKTKTNTKNT